MSNLNTCVSNVSLLSYLTISYSTNVANIVASIFAKIVNLNDLSVGILSLRTLDECNLNIAIDEHDSTKIL